MGMFGLYSKFNTLIHFTYKNYILYETHLYCATPSKLMTRSKMATQFICFLPPPSDDVTFIANRRSYHVAIFHLSGCSALPISRCHNSKSVATHWGIQCNRFSIKATDCYNKQKKFSFTVLVLDKFGCLHLAPRLRS